MLNRVLLPLVALLLAIGPLERVHAVGEPPPAPEHLWAGQMGEGEWVSLNWTAVSGAIRYRVFRGESADQMSEIAEVWSGWGESHMDLDWSVFAYYAVAAENEHGLGPLSTRAVVVRAPYNFAASGGTSIEGVTLAWSAVPRATHYRVSRVDSLGGSTELGTTTVPSLSDHTADPGVVYTYWLRAVNVEQLESASASAIGYRGLSSPQNVQATDGTSTDHVEISWAGVPGAIEYEVFRSPVGGAPTTLAVVSGSSYDDVPPAVGVEFSYSVRSLGAEGISPSALSASDLGYVCVAAPAGLSATFGTEQGVVRLEWMAAAGAVGYEVFRSVGVTDDGWQSVGTTNGTSYQDSVWPGFLHGYRVRSLASSMCPESGFTASALGYSRVAPPANVQASDGLYELSVSWESVVGAAGYEIWRSDANSELVKIAEVDGHTCAFTDFTASGCVAHQYSVRTIGGPVLHTSEFADPDTGYIGLRAPYVSGVSEGVSDHEISVSWWPVSMCGFVGYEVLRKEVGAEVWQQLVVTDMTTESFTDPSAEHGRVYWYGVRALGVAGIAPSEMSYGRGYLRLLSPGSVSASDGTSASAVTLTWGAVAGATGYEVLRAVGGDPATVVGSSSGTSYEDTAASFGVEYLYSVRATGAEGVSAGAPSASDAGYRRLLSPGSVSASDGISASEVTLAWGAVAGATGYEVLRAVGGGDPSVIGTSATLGYTDITASPGVTYSYWVRAMGPPSGNVSDLGVPDTGYVGLSAPGSVTASDGTSTAHVLVTWGAVPGATGYKILRTLNDGPTIEVATVGGSTLSFNDAHSGQSTAPQYGQIYTYTVRAVYGPGPGVPSASDIGYLRVLAPVDVQASDGASVSHVTVTWAVTPGASAYQVFRAQGSSPLSMIGTVEGIATFQDDDTLPGVAYDYSVKAIGNPLSNISEFSALDGGYRKLAAPTGLLASDGESQQHVTLTWTATPGATGYHILWGTSPGSLEELTAVGNVTQYSDASAPPGAIRYYAVRGFSGTGLGERSAIESGYRGLIAPTNVQATDGTIASHVAVTWTAVGGASGYRVLRGIGGGTVEVGSVSGGLVTTFADVYSDAGTSPQYGQVYSYSVRAISESGLGPSSASDSGHLKMAVPGGFSASDGTVEQGVTLTWTASPGATGYQLFRAVGTGNWTQIVAPSGESTVYTDNSAAIGTLYSYRIRSIGNPSGNVSDFSPTNVGYRGLVTPANLMATDGTFTDKVRVTWTQVPGATGYKVLRGTAADEASLVQVATRSGAGTTTYDDTGAPSGVTRYYAVRAVTGAGDTALSQIDAGYRGLGAPANVQASDGTSAAQVNVTWSAVAGATGYQVRRAVGSGPVTVVGTVEGGSTLSFADAYSDSGTSPQYGQVYNYTVRALSAAGPGAVSAANAGHLKLLPPTDVSASDGTSGAGVVVTWTASPGATGYRVFRAEGSAAPAQVGTTTGATTLTNTSAVPGRVYSYSVRATGVPSSNVSDPSTADTGYRALAAPTNVLASDGTSAAHVAITWTAATGAVSYKVFRDGSETPLQSGVTGTAFNDTSAVPGVSYTYAVRSVAAAGDSPLSGSNAGYRQMTAPANVQASDGTLTTGIAVTWNAVPGAVTYQVFRSGTAAAIANVPDLEHVDTPAGSGPPVAGTAYTYTVRAVGAAAGAVSSASAGNAGYRSLASPTGVAASDGASTANVGVTWTGVTGATGYRIFRAPAGSSAATAVGNVGGAARTFNDTTATPGTWFTYSVAATTSAGPSMRSEADIGYRRLSVPGNVQASDGTSTAHVRVSWSASAGAGTYEVFRRIGSAEDEQIGTVTAPALLYDDTSAVPGVSYSYSVRSVGITPPEGLEQPVSAKSAVNAGFRQMPAPTGVLASDGTSLTQVAVTWNSVPGAVSYRVFRGTTSIATGITGTSFEDTGATQGTRFSYTVRAVGAASSALSAASAADFGYRNRPGPTAVQATDTDPSKVRVTWTLAASGSPAVTGYEVRRIEDGVGAVTLTSTLGATATSFDDITAVPGTVYTYEVRARYRLTGPSPAQFVTTLPGSDTGIRPSAFGSGDGGLAGEDGDGQSGAGEGGVASTETGGSGDSPGSVTGGGMVTGPSPKAAGRSDESSVSVAGEDSVAALSCHDVMAGLLARIMELEDEIGELPEADADGSRSRRVLLAALRTLLDPVHGGKDAEDPDQPQDGTPRACVMASGDVNCDGTVDGRDFAAFMDAWAARDEAHADLNRDGQIDGRDLTLLLARLPPGGD